VGKDGGRGVVIVVEATRRVLRYGVGHIPYTQQQQQRAGGNTVIQERKKYQKPKNEAAAAQPTPGEGS